MKDILKIIFTAFSISLLFGLFLLYGCSKTPTQTVIDNHVQLVDDAIDYAQNNMTNDADTQLLINSLKTCKTGLIDTAQSYKAELATCESETNKWRIVSLGLFLLICAWLAKRIKGVF